MAHIEWVIKATGERKRITESMDSTTAQKFCAWLNKPNSASVYCVVEV